MKLLTNEQQKLFQSSKICNICKERSEDKHAKDKKYCRVRNHYLYTGEYKGAARSIYNLKYGVPKEVPIVLYDGSS